jgi:MFS transporter, SP family, arabinose:H+ symporter
MGEENPEAELADIRKALDEEHAVEHEPVFRWKYRYPLFLAISIGMFNQLAGINAILYYVNNIFAAAGFNQISSDQQSVAVGATLFIFTIVGMALIDKLGRKTLLLIGAAGCSTCLAGVTWVFATHSHQSWLLPIVVVYMAFFSVSQGAVIWVYIGEVFPTLVRSKGQGIGSASHWLSDTIIALEFPVVVNYFHTATPFAFFAIMTVIQFFVVLFVYPETKGQTLEDLQRRLVP